MSHAMISSCASVSLYFHQLCLSHIVLLWLFILNFIIIYYLQKSTYLLYNLPIHMFVSEKESVHLTVPRVIVPDRIVLPHVGQVMQISYTFCWTENFLGNTVFLVWPVNKSVFFFACGSTCLLLVEFPLNLLVVTGVVDNGPGQLCLDVSQPGAQAAHVFI